MKEQLPKDCISLMNKLAKAFSDNDNALLGFKVRMSQLGNNSFKLVINVNPETNDTENLYYIMGLYDSITVPINSLVKNTYPDICFRPTNFISIKTLCNKYKLNESIIAKQIFHQLKQLYNHDKKNYRHNTFLCSNLSNWNMHLKSVSVSSFTEFLIWIDLNA